MICQVIVTFWLGLSYDQVEDKCIDDTIKDFFFGFIKMFNNISDTLGYRLVYHFFVLSTLWRHLLTITEQNHG